MSGGKWFGVFRLPSSLRRVDRDVDAELRFHFESRIDDLVREGRTRDAARLIAEQEYGDVVASRRELGEVGRRSVAKARRADVLDVVRQNVSYALRGLRLQPGFAAMVIVLLALAIGANATVFSIVDRLLLQPPPGVYEPENIRRLYANFPMSRSAVNGKAANQVFSYPEFRAIRQALGSAGRVAAYTRWDSTEVAAGTDTVFGNQGYVTAEFLPMLVGRPAQGRFFTEEEDDVLGPRNVAVITPRFARRAFGESNPLGRTICARGRRYIVIGVLPPDFQGIEVSAVDFWTPFSTQRPVNDRDRQWYTRQEVFIRLIARVDTAISDRALEARLTGPYRLAWSTKLPTYQGRAVVAASIIPARGPMERGQEVTIATRLAAVAGIVLLVACANVANLLLLRATRRRREIAVRLSLGISRRRLAAQFLTESAVLSIIAATVAVVVSRWVGALLRTALLPRVQWVGASVNWRVLAFSGVATALGAFLAGLFPSLAATREDIAGALRGTNSAPRFSRLRATLLATQVALSLVLLTGAGLFLGSLRQVARVDLGFDTQHVILGSVFFSDRKAHPEIKPALATLAERARTMPGVREVSVATGVPLRSWMGGVELFLPGHDSAVSNIEVAYNGVETNYFAAAGTRIVAGRAFRPDDRGGSAPVMIVSQSLARSIWPNENALGKCLIVETRSQPCSSIVGIAADVHAFRIIEEPQKQFYLPVEQSPYSAAHAFVIRTQEADADAIAALLTADLRRSLPGATVSARTGSDLLDPQLRPWRLGAQLFSVMGVLSLVVAAIGLYCVIAFGMQQRDKEIGLRIALGAGRSDLARLVARQSAIPIVAGVIAGAGVALASGRFIAALLYGVSPRDPIALGVAVATLLAAGVAASVGPLRRAARVDPATMLRVD
jgi:predicted permease